jgi:selenophosphate synthase
MSEQGTVVGALTDGTGVSPMNTTKFVKDFIADVLLSGAAALAAAQVIDVGSAVDSPQVAAFALIGATIRAAYRAALRWATTD